MAGENLRMIAAQVAEEMMRPSVVYKAGLYDDGEYWVATFDGGAIAAKGKSPAAAMAAFDVAWNQSKVQEPK